MRWTCGARPMYSTLKARPVLDPLHGERMLLTPDELVELTGYQRMSNQAQMLEAWGIEYLCGADGKLKVSRARVLDRLGLRSESASGPALNF